MLLLKIIGLYALAVLVFLWEWLAEQPSSIRMAYYHSFAEAHEDIKKLIRKSN